MHQLLPAVFGKVPTAVRELGTFYKHLIKDFEWKNVSFSDPRYISNDIIQIYKTETTTENVFQSPVDTLRLQITMSLKLTQQVNKI